MKYNYGILFSGDNMKILCDTHVHSNNSFDGENTVKEICDAAVENELSIISITDHMEAPEIDLGEKSQFGDMKNMIAKSVFDARSCAEEYSGKLKVLSGVELGEPMHYPELTKKALAVADFDFILASVHFLKDEEDFYDLDFSSVDVNKLLKRYFDELLDTALNADFDSLAHLTYPMRYIIERTDLNPDLNDYSETIDKIFMTLANREKALEINTSGLFKPIGTTLPDINLVKRFRELGGKYITIGSDAHVTGNLAKGIEKGMEIARICGFEHFTYFENRQPKMVEIWY